MNHDQKKSLSDLERFGNNFSVSVLQGVTGSGKTLVYFEKIKKVLKTNKQVLVMLPEIFLTNQFGKDLAIFSDLNRAFGIQKLLQKLKEKFGKGL